MASPPPFTDFGRPAPDFTLPATDGRTYSLADIAGPHGSLIIFMCNHCPYVLGILDRLGEEARALQSLGIGVAAINANDALAFPADSFDKMVTLAEDHALPFPYLHDADQSVARAYGAVCTPDFFGYDGALGLQYRGRLDDGGKAPAKPGRQRELYAAMAEVAAGRPAPAEQVPTMGCAIKWKAAI